MKAILDDTLFASGASNLSLLSFFTHAEAGRHRVELDEQGQHFQCWLAGRDRQTQEEVAFALDTSRDDARATSKRTIVVKNVVRSDWTARPRVLTLADAKKLLDLPFWLFLENWQTDYHFLLAASTTEQKKEIEKWRSNRWLEAQNGGGLTDMYKRILSIKTSEPDRCLAIWVLFDSDARAAGKPSKQSKGLRGVCGQQIPFHQLKRRTIENYVSLRGLRIWSEKRDDTLLQHRVKAFGDMPEDEQRYHFPMKTGLGGDVDQGVNEALYGSPRLETTHRKRLEFGFGHKLRDVFSDADIGIGTNDLIQDKSFEELNKAITDLLGWMK
jgi:hypothetical protein